MAFGNGPRLVTTGLDLLVDAADRQSYPGSGTSWRDLKSTITGSLTGSISYTSEFYGGLTFTDSSSAVIFPSTVANYGTGSFTVEMAFKPTFINGRHYLMSKNSGSFPNWAIYLSGSGGSGKLWSEFRISSTVSCSASSSTTFVTGSVYQVDVRIFPALSASGIYVNGQSEGGTLGNGGGSLTTTASLFVGNFSQNNTQNFSGSIYTIKTYLQASTEQPVINFNATSTRFSKPPLPDTTKKRYEVLVVAGGGGSGRRWGGGGGAGGLQYTTTTVLTAGLNTVIVGSGAPAAASDAVVTNGQNSSLGSIISIGGGRGAGQSFTGSFGGSGGGSSYTQQTPAGLGIPGQGNDGATNGFNGGGGGGAGTPGLGFNGGSGSYIEAFSAIGGSPAGWFAGGGSGGGGTIISGGIGGGGNSGGSSAIGGTGSANTGGGGGGGGFDSMGGAGGSGIVAIRYSGGPIALGGEITQSEGYTYHVFRTVGTSSFTIF